MLFLARDEVSFNTAKQMFPDIAVRLFPDIVTSLIGTKQFSYERNGILLCCRNDSERYYQENDLNSLCEKLKTIDEVVKTDTTLRGERSEIVSNAEKYIWDEIEKYAQFKCIITDRYHGTIFSMIASTPVIVIRTNDHKVTTGVNWFEGIYDGHVFRANSLEEVYDLVDNIYHSNIPMITTSYFKQEYYDKLPTLFKEVIGRKA